MDKTYWKFTTESACHNGLHMKEGLNTALEPWNTDVCAPGGIYAADPDHPHCPQWTRYRDGLTHVWDYRVAENSPWQIEYNGKIKAHQVILSNCRHINVLADEMTDQQFNMALTGGMFHGHPRLIRVQEEIERQRREQARLRMEQERIRMEQERQKMLSIRLRNIELVPNPRPEEIKRVLERMPHNWHLVDDPERPSYMRLVRK